MPIPARRIGTMASFLPAMTGASMVSSGVSILRVVLPARKTLCAQGVAPSGAGGAHSGARVAAYLRGDSETNPSTEKVLEKLTLPQAVAPTWSGEP